MVICEKEYTVDRDYNKIYLSCMKRSKYSTNSNFFSSTQSPGETSKAAGARLDIAKVVVVDGVGEEDASQHAHVAAALRPVERLCPIRPPHVLLNPTAPLSPLAPPARCELASDRSHSKQIERAQLGEQN